MLPVPPHVDPLGPPAGPWCFWLCVPAPWVGGHRARGLLLLLFYLPPCFFTPKK